MAKWLASMTQLQRHLFSGSSWRKSLKMRPVKEISGVKINGNVA
jgi:hypothetical protein